MAGSGTFKANAAVQAANLPAELPFSQADLASGLISFEIRWEDTAPDSASDIYEGVYRGAIKQFRVKIGNTELTLPVQEALIKVSDGGFGKVNRESVRIETAQSFGRFSLSAGWILNNEQASTADLRGAPGVLDSDQAPSAARLARFVASGPYDKAFFVVLKDSDSATLYPVYINTSSFKIDQYGPSSGNACPNCVLPPQAGSR